MPGKDAEGKKTSFTYVLTYLILCTNIQLLVVGNHMTCFLRVWALYNIWCTTPCGMRFAYTSVQPWFTLCSAYVLAETIRIATDAAKKLKTDQFRLITVFINKSNGFRQCRNQMFVFRLQQCSSCSYDVVHYAPPTTIDPSADPDLRGQRIDSYTEWNPQRRKIQGLTCQLRYFLSPLGGQPRTTQGANTPFTVYLYRIATGPRGDENVKPRGWHLGQLVTITSSYFLSHTNVYGLPHGRWRRAQSVLTELRIELHAADWQFVVPHTAEPSAKHYFRRTAQPINQRPFGESKSGVQPSPDREFLSVTYKVGPGASPACLWRHRV